MFWKKKQLTQAAEKSNNCNRICCTDYWSKQETIHPWPTIIKDKPCHHSTQRCCNSHSWYSNNAYLKTCPSQWISMKKLSVHHINHMQGAFIIQIIQIPGWTFYKKCAHPSQMLIQIAGQVEMLPTVSVGYWLPILCNWNKMCVHIIFSCSSYSYNLYNIVYT